MTLTVRDMLGLAAFLVLCFGAAAIGGWLTSASVGTWYPTLNKPSWNPPDSLFGPVWTVLFLMMAVSAWLIWQKYGWSAAVVPLAVFLLQLVLNVVWSGLFFALRNPKLAFFEILILWLAILVTIIAFGKFRAVAAWLLVPYLIWVSYAVALNFTIWRLNV